MEVTWRTRAYGREGQLEKLNKTRNDWSKQPWIRRKADETYRKIVAQIQDKKLMAMRERLIKASLAGDARAQALIQMQMKHYLGEDPETGLYEQDK